MIKPVEIAILISIAAILTRLWRGPTAWDRLLAYNSAANRIVSILAITAIGSQQRAFLDIAVVYAALSFLGVVVLARFLERGGGFR